MKTAEELKEEIKRTVGYSEAENKESFMVGVDVAFNKLEIIYLEKIEILKQQLALSDNTKTKYLNDLKTLTSIIERYAED